MKKTILQINTVVNAGATGRMAEEIGDVALRNGWSSHIAYGRNERTSSSKLIRIGTDWDINLHVLQTRLLDQHGWGSVRSTRELVRQIENIKPDIIHLLNLHGYYLNFKILFNYLKSTQIPVVWTVLDCWPFTGHCTYFDTIGCYKWKTQCFQCPLIKDYPSSWGYDNSQQNYEAKKAVFTSLPNLTLVAHSAWLQTLIGQSYLGHLPVMLINNGVNLDKFYYSENRNFVIKNKLDGFKLILGVANNWIKRKGLDDFLKLSACVTEDTRIIMVGLSNGEVRDLPKNILNVPKTESIQELIELYSSADVFINPTWEDNFPTTNLESLACGTPVITYDTGGSPEAIDADTGIVVKKGDINGLAAAANLVFARGKAAYHQACIERARKRFDKEDRFRDYLSLFEETIGKALAE